MSFASHCAAPNVPCAVRLSSLSGNALRPALSLVVDYFSGTLFKQWLKESEKTAPR